MFSRRNGSRMRDLRLATTIAPWQLGGRRRLCRRRGHRSPDVLRDAVRVRPMRRGSRPVTGDRIEAHMLGEAVGSGFDVSQEWRLVPRAGTGAAGVRSAEDGVVGGAVPLSQRPVSCWPMVSSHFLHGTRNAVVKATPRGSLSATTEMSFLVLTDREDRRGALGPGEPQGTEQVHGASVGLGAAPRALPVLAAVGESGSTCARHTRVRRSQSQWAPSSACSQSSSVPNRSMRLLKDCACWKSVLMWGTAGIPPGD